MYLSVDDRGKSTDQRPQHVLTVDVFYAAFLEQNGKGYIFSIYDAAVFLFLFGS